MLRASTPLPVMFTEVHQPSAPSCLRSRASRGARRWAELEKHRDVQLASKWFSLGSDIRPVALIGAALALRGAASSQKQQQQQPARTLLSWSRGRTSGPSLTCRRATSDDVQGLEQRALAGDADAACALGEAYERGESVTQDRQKAMEWFEKASELGSVTGQYRLGRLLCSGDDAMTDKVAGMQSLKKAASAGNLSAKYSLGSMLMQGDGVEKDTTSAMKYLEEAAQGDHMGAQYALGCILAATPEEEFEAKAWAGHWLNRASEQGCVRSVHQIGMLHLTGCGRPKDPEAGASWISEAANKGYAQAQYTMATLLLGGVGVEENREWAAYWFEEAAKQGHVDAQYNLGLMFESGDGIPEDKEKASYWLSLAAAQGDEDAAQVSKEVGGVA